MTTADTAISADAIRAAAQRIRGGIIETPTIDAVSLAARFGMPIALKLECLQRTGSFKERGALNRLIGLGPAERQAGVIACSAGNHAQSLAFHAQRLGIPATIVMPADTPFVKVARTEAFGATILLEGADLSEAAETAERHARRTRRFTAAALHTRFHESDERGVGVGALPMHVAHRRDAAAWRRRLLATDSIGRAVRQAQPTADAGGQLVVVESESHRAAR